LGAVAGAGVFSPTNATPRRARHPRPFTARISTEVNRAVQRHAAARGPRAVGRQSNHESELVDWIQAAAREGFRGIVFNPGARSHYSIALGDAVASIRVLVVEGAPLQHPRP
jgi:3-dehydroquinate dehydratase II